MTGLPPSLHSTEDSSSSVPAQAEARAFEVSDSGGVSVVMAASAELAVRGYARSTAPAGRAVMVRMNDSASGVWAVSVQKEKGHGWLTRVVKVAEASLKDLPADSEQHSGAR